MTKSIRLKGDVVTNEEASELLMLGMVLIDVDTGELTFANDDAMHPLRAQTADKFTGHPKISMTGAVATSISYPFDGTRDVIMQTTLSYGKNPPVDMNNALEANSFYAADISVILNGPENWVGDVLGEIVTVGAVIRQKLQSLNSPYLNAIRVSKNAGTTWDKWFAGR